MLKLTVTSLVFYQLFTGRFRVLLVFMLMYFHDSNNLFKKILSVITSTAIEVRMQIFLEPEIVNQGDRMKDYHELENSNMNSFFQDPVV